MGGPATIEELAEKQAVLSKEVGEAKEAKLLDAKREQLARHQDELREIASVTPVNIIPEREAKELKRIVVGFANGALDKAHGDIAKAVVNWTAVEWEAELSQRFPPTLAPNANKIIFEVGAWLDQFPKILRAIAVERHRLYVQKTTPQKMHLEQEIAKLKGDLGVR
ncbi:MAG TPA: hypothetical protein ENH62_17125 [Marinobacter sp.]|uniref:Uncharacterized protein n=1 Tax=marine sediment metagenome TaxID=412755 RepID=A0A0F9QWC3_9ZZZZ|nr:hypothetical protein [Marinobacter sp.]